VTFAFIDAEKVLFPVVFKCERLWVLRAGYYAWRARQATLRRGWLRKSSRPRYSGRFTAPSVRPTAFRESLRSCALHSGGRSTASVSPTYMPFRAFRCSSTHRGRLANPVTFADDLMARSFRPARPHQLWVVVITQHPTHEGWDSSAVGLMRTYVSSWAPQPRIICGPSSPPTRSMWRTWRRRP
jgi:hypothetical protein